MQISLNGEWKVSHIPYNGQLADILDNSFVPEGWLDAQVPEEIHATLRKAGIIRGHVYSKDPDEEKWIEEADWVYYKEFFADTAWKAERVNLEFKGLDTFCDIYLNGAKIGSGQNMHIPHVTDIADVLKYGARNVIVVRFYSAVKYVEQMDQKGIFSITDSDRIMARKAQMNYGWDFVGRCVTAGIWKDVVIHSLNDAQIDSYYLYTKKIEGGSASIGLEVEPDAGTSDLEDYTLTVRLVKDSQEVFVREGSFADFESLEIPVENPSLWWPRPYGKPELYDFQLLLKKNGKVIQEKRQKFGIRTIEIIQENQTDGKSFIFAVNGKRLFIRGANWVPARVIYTDITDQDYEELIDYAIEGNISMLRIWGGGIYESHRMFELCDESGILIWHDFMLACGIYPQNDEFLQNVAVEAEYVLKEYRNYTSIAIWTGDNENGQAYGWAGRPYEFQNDKPSYIVIDEACRRLDPHRIYFPSSPSSPDESFKGGDNPNSPYQGDTHLYIMAADPGINGKRHYGYHYYKRIKSYKPRFMSEFGFISLPEKDTFYKFNFLREPIHHRDELIEFLPFTKDYMENVDHEKTIYYSQVYNAMALKYWLEYFRSLKWTCGGTLYWKLNDPIADRTNDYLFPSHMATVDMYKKPKMTYYYTRRAYDDLIVICDETDSGFDVYACSELVEDIKGKLVVSHRDFSGNVIAVKEWERTADRDSVTRLCSLSADEFRAEDPYSEYIKMEFITDRGIIENRYFFTDIHEINKLRLVDSGLKIVYGKRSGNEIVLRLQTDFYARNVRLNILDTRAEYSDNYFEMDAGSEKTVSIRLRDVAGLESKVLYVEGENVRREVLSLAEI
ncbi:beta-mannosidase [Gorillibacterium massiliense]|uniref:beta-mannosidase n=1 Tax=Gorillibacterium massiliense TaxID=1280390 RepID=UPI0004B46213|nr:sugar-binding domain-containing protein [Gorillibacterium massiliense]